MSVFLAVSMSFAVSAYLAVKSHLDAGGISILRTHALLFLLSWYFQSGVPKFRQPRGVQFRVCCAEGGAFLVRLWNSGNGV